MGKVIETLVEGEWKRTKNVYQVRSGEPINITDEILQAAKNGIPLHVPTVRVVDVDVER